MRRNGILIAFACITFLAGIGAAVELFGGNDVQFSDGSGGASGGPFLYQDSDDTFSNLALGVSAYAWADDGSKGNGSAAFTGSGSVTNFMNLTDDEDARGFIQSVNYTGRVQATVSKTSIDGEASAAAEVGASTFASKSEVDDEYVSGRAGLFTSIGDSEFMDENDEDFNGMGTATAVASGSAHYDAQYISQSDQNGRNASVKVSGNARGDAYINAENKKFLGEDSSTDGFACMGTISNAGN